jgi:hypothetical protein
MTKNLDIRIYTGKGCNPQRIADFLALLGHKLTPISHGELTSLPDSGASLLMFPGGWYPIGKDEGAAIRKYVDQGGGCVGICAGSYQVGGYIPVIPGRVLRSNFRGRAYLEPKQGDHPVLQGVARRCTRHRDREWEQVPVTQLGGPLMLPEDRSWTIASFDFEGEVSALSAAELGRGRAVAISSHPELAMADVPSADTLGPWPTPEKATFGDRRAILANAVRWAAGQSVDPEGDLARLPVEAPPLR